jgi:hypothetical protein
MLVQQYDQFIFCTEVLVLLFLSKLIDEGKKKKLPSMSIFKRDMSLSFSAMGFILASHFSKFFKVLSVFSTATIFSALLLAIPTNMRIAPYTAPFFHREVPVWRAHVVLRQPKLFLGNIRWIKI